MIPITRKELYLNKIVGNDDYDIPEKPITTEEFFFAEILGEAVQAPEPLTRYQMYLARIAGREIEIPYPETRLEYFLARAAGMDVETLTPITREEIFWSNYSAIVDFEVEGVPPLTYKAIEGTLENYRIYGNTVNGENVGDLITEGEHAGEYSVPVTVSNGTDTLTTPIYLPEQIRKVGDEAEYIDYGSQKQHRVRKNLLQPKLPSMTLYEATCTVNADGSITCDTNGQILSGNAFFSIDDEFIISKPCILSGCHQNGGPNKYRLYAVTLSQPPEYAFDDGDGAVINFTNRIMGVRMAVYAGQVCDNLTFYPMIRLATIEDDTYEPYIENTEVDVTLPTLPTLPGTNVLSVGTAVQPSKVYVKYKGERQ